MRRLPARCCIAPAASRSRAPPRGMPAPAASEPCLSDGALEPDPHGPGRTLPGHAARAHSLLSENALTLLPDPVSVRRTREINIVSELFQFFSTPTSTGSSRSSSASTRSIGMRRAPAAPRDPKKPLALEPYSLLFLLRARAQAVVSGSF